jgi:hypothetical protein
MYREEKAFVRLDFVPAFVGTGAVSLTKLRIELKQEALFSALRTTFHPFALRHERYRHFQVGDPDCFWLLLDFDYFLSSIFGEEDAWSES